MLELGCFLIHRRPGILMAPKAHTALPSLHQGGRLRGMWAVTLHTINALSHMAVRLCEIPLCVLVTVQAQRGIPHPQPQRIFGLAALVTRSAPLTGKGLVTGFLDEAPLFRTVGAVTGHAVRAGHRITQVGLLCPGCLYGMTRSTQPLRRGPGQGMVIRGMRVVTSETLSVLYGHVLKFLFKASFFGMAPEAELGSGPPQQIGILGRVWTVTGQALA